MHARRFNFEEVLRTAKTAIADAEARGRDCTGARALLDQATRQVAGRVLRMADFRATADNSGRQIVQ